jgi:cytochrome c peroxidase
MTTPTRLLACAIGSAAILTLVACGEAIPAWEKESPLEPIPDTPLGVQADWEFLAEDQGLTVTAEKVRLGRWLFFDTRLSVDNTISCATCHKPENGYSEPTPVSTGVNDQKGGRKAPPIVNAAFPFYPVYFWDGRAASLAEQAKGPIINPIEMANTHDNVVATLKAIAGYRMAFAAAYGDDRIDIDRVADAIAAFEATEMAGNSPWDRYKAGDDNAVSDQVKLGGELFEGKAACTECHVSWNFTDSKFHSLGVGWDAAQGAYADTGRHQVTSKDEDLGAFKTPTMRDVALHAPFMHDGSMTTLKEVVEHYNKGGEEGAANLSPKLKKLQLTAAEVDALVAFMEALTSEPARSPGPTQFPQ